MINKKYIAIALGICLGSAISTQAADSKDLENFVRAMVELKRVGATCESFVAGSPLSQMGEVDAYFATLGQPVPTPIDTATKNSLQRLIKQQAASICSEKLQKAENQYGRAASAYMASKAENWPAAPQVHFPKWCQDPSCADVQ